MARNRLSLIELLFGCLVLILTSCNEMDDGCPDTTQTVNYNVSADAKAKVPYAGNDTIMFRSDAGDTAKLIGSGWKSSLKTVSEGRPTCKPTISTTSETLTLTFTGTSTKLPWLKVELTASQYPTGIAISVFELR